MQVIGDLIGLSEEERKQHYIDVCSALRINPATRPLAYFEQVGYGGKRVLVLYTLRGGAQQIASANDINTSVARDRDSEVDGVVAFKAKAFKGTRGVEAVGASVIAKANNPADAVMTAQTKATRRAILDFTGSGLLDETEVEGMSGSTIECDPGVGTESYVPPPPAPAPSAEPAEEVVEFVISKEILDASNELLQNMVNKTHDEIVAAAATGAPPVAPNVFDNKAEMDRITIRLNGYRRETLQLGGMRPSKGFGIAAKWSKFLAKHAPNKTIEEYQILLNELDATLVNGPAAVVALIESHIA